MRQVVRVHLGSALCTKTGVGTVFNGDHDGCLMSFCSLHGADSNVIHSAMER